MDDPDVAELDPPLRATDRGSVPKKIVGPMLWRAHPIGALLSILMTVVIVGGFEVLYAGVDGSPDSDVFYLSIMVLFVGTPLALIVGWPLSVLLDRILLVRTSVRAVHVISYAVAAALIAISMVMAPLLELGDGLGARDLLLLGGLAAAAGVSAALSRYLMRRFERAA